MVRVGKKVKKRKIKWLSRRVVWSNRFTETEVCETFGYFNASVTREARKREREKTKWSQQVGQLVSARVTRTVSCDWCQTLARQLPHCLSCRPFNNYRWHGPLRRPAVCATSLACLRAGRHGFDLGCSWHPPLACLATVFARVLRVVPLVTAIRMCGRAGRRGFHLGCFCMRLLACF